MDDGKITRSQFKIINNDPCGEDLFEGQAHKKIADKICDEIKNNSNCIMIGIEGGWGSGKSNLIKLVENRLKQKEKLKQKFYFFTYDAWGHQEDIQRRAIIEELTDHLVKTREKEGDESFLHKKLKSLLAKKKETTASTIPKLSIGIIIYILSIYFLQLLNIIKDSTMSICMQMVLFSVPLVLYSIILAYKTNKGKKSGNKEPFKSALSELFTLYQKDSMETTTLEVISEANPSSREFRNWMLDISKYIGMDVLVIVFDNMDRLPKDKVQELWSSIHTFFAERIESGNGNIRVLLPFDRSHVRCAFRYEDMNNSLDPNVDIPSFGDDYINKTFDVVYRVPPPMMVDWKKYFRLKWLEAFGNTNLDETNYNKVTQIYDLLSSDQTPRKIIAFINEFVTIKQTLLDDIPDEYIALFIFGKTKISERPQSEVFNPTYLNSLAFLYSRDTNLPSNIASLYYQLPLIQVTNVVFIDSLTKALNNGDETIVSDISNSMEFFELLDNAVTNVSNIPNCVQVLNTVFASKNEEARIKHIWKCIIELVYERELKEYALLDYQIVLIRNIENKQEYMKKIIEEYRTHESFSVLDYYNSINMLANLNIINVFENLESKEVDVDSFITFLMIAKEEYSKYQISSDYGKLDETLSKIDESEIEKMKCISYLSPECEVPKFLNRIDSYIKSLSAKGNVIKQLFTPNQKNKALPDEILYARLKRADNDSVVYYDLICMLLIKYNNLNLQHKSLLLSILENTSNEFVMNISGIIEHHIGYGELLINFSKMQFGLHKSIVKYLIGTNQKRKKLNILDVLINYQTILVCSGVGPETFINHLNQWSWEAKTLINESTIQDVHIRFFIDGDSISLPLVSYCKDVLLRSLRSIETNTWEKSILVNDKNFQLLRIIRIESPPNFVDGLKNALNIIFESGQNLNSYKHIQNFMSENGYGNMNLRRIIQDKEDY